MARGLPNDGIAARLSLSPKTVRNYVSSVFAKLQVASRAEAIVRAREAGIG
jgi:DNA-binding NarL/FixJ family response regulator